MSLLCENLPVALVFLTVAGFSWIFGGANAPMLMPVMPWLWALALETLLFFPQRHFGESFADARARVWKSLSRDPITYLTLSFLVVLLMPLFNCGLCKVCDYPKILAGADPAPPIPFSPFCVNPREHLGVVVWFVPSLTALLAVRHSLARHGRRLLVHILVWNGALLASFGFIQQATGAEAPYWIVAKNPVEFFSSFGYPNMGGAFFVAVFAVAAGLWQDNVRRDVSAAAAKKKVAQEQEGETNPKEKYCPQWVKTHYLLIPVALCFFGALATLSRAAILLSFAILGFWFIYLCLSLFTSRKNLSRVKLHFGMLVGIVLTVVLVGIFAPDNFMKEVSTVSPMVVADRVTGKAQYHTRVASAIFKDHPLFGVGGWGYKHFCFDYMTDDDRRHMQIVGGVNVHNDYMQFLCEHGAIGGALLLAILISLIVPVFREWAERARVAHFVKGSDIPRPTALFCVPAVVVGILLAATANIVHAFGDCVFRSPAVLSQFLLLLACAPGFIEGDEGGGK